MLHMSAHTTHLVQGIAIFGSLGLGWTALWLRWLFKAGRGDYDN